MLKKIILLTLFILVLFSNLAIAGNPAIITLYNGKFPVSVIVDDYSGKSPTERDVLKAQYQLEFNICSKLGITIRNLGGGFYDLRSGRRGVSPEQDAVRLILEDLTKR